MIECMVKNVCVRKFRIPFMLVRVTCYAQWKQQLCTSPLYQFRGRGWPENQETGHPSPFSFISVV